MPRWLTHPPHSSRPVAVQPAPSSTAEAPLGRDFGHDALGGRGVQSRRHRDAFDLSIRAVPVNAHGLLVERIPATQDHLHAIEIDAASPLADEERGDSVAREVDERASFRHESVDSDDDSNSVDEVRTMRLPTSGERREPGTGKTGRTFRRDHHEHEKTDLLSDVERLAEILGDEPRPSAACSAAALPR